MKTSVFLGLALLALAPAPAQVFRPEAASGAVIGGIAGAVIGNNSGSLQHDAWKGATIGAGTGLLLGQAIGSANADARYHRGGGVYAHGRPAVVYAGYRRGPWAGHYRLSHVSYHGAYYGYPAYGISYYEPYGYYGYRSAAADGLWLGALAGGIIGHNSGEFRHNGWRGAAWGAGIGWLLGSIADAHRRDVVYEQPAVVTPPAAATQPQTQAPQQVTIINNYYGTSATPMSSANALFGR